MGCTTSRHLDVALPEAFRVSKTVHAKTPIRHWSCNAAHWRLMVMQTIAKKFL